MSPGPAHIVAVARQAAVRAWRWARARWKVFFAIAAVLIAGAGLLALAAATTTVVALAMLAVIVLAALPDAWKAKALEAIGGILAATAGLMGMNLLVFDPLARLVGGQTPDTRAWIVVGLVFAVVAFFAMVAWYVRFRGRWSVKGSAIFGLVAALLAVLVAPLAVYEYQHRDDVETTQVTEPVRSKLDVSIVAERAQPSAELPEVPAEESPAGLEVRYSVGFRDGRDVRWTLIGARDAADALRAVQAGGSRAVRDRRHRPQAAAAPEPRADADQLVLLLVDGTPPVLDRPGDLPEVDASPSEVERWRAVARAAGGAEAPAFALLQTTNADRLRDWTDPDSPVRQVSIQQELTSPTVTDAAVKLATGAPSSQEDFELALLHRPVLLFDSDEPVPRPLSVDALFAGDDVSQCDDAGTSTNCEPIGDPRKLLNGGKRLELALPGTDELRGVAKRELATVREKGPEALSMGDPLTTMYVHPTAREVNGRRRLYLDYWWYLPDNPARSGWRTFCGAGLVIPGVTCFNHQSDWEGITVVIDRTERRGRVDPRPVAVHYAQHNSVVSYDWDELQTHWKGDSGLKERLDKIPGVEERPLVFVAAGTHASYATRCPGIVKKCRQLGHDLEEQEHNGRLSWGGNYSTLCGEGSSCLQLLPTRVGGTQPALWNAFKGPWGARRCVLGVYCNSGDPPRGPGQQNRYARPALANGEGNLEKGAKPFTPRTVVDE